MFIMLYNKILSISYRCVARFDHFNATHFTNKYLSVNTNRLKTLVAAFLHKIMNCK